MATVAVYFGAPYAGQSSRVVPPNLRNSGINTETGYTGLPFEPLQRDKILRHLAASTSTWLTDLTVLPWVDSTNNWLMQQPDPAGAVVLAEFQSQGRGRRGRTWNARMGEHIALSLAFERTEKASLISSLSLVSGLAAVTALDTLGVAGVELKWPNDLLLNGAKLGGILTELHQLGSRQVVVIGLGLNLLGAQRLQQQFDRPIADLSEFADRIRRNRLAAELINSLVAFEQAHRDRGFESMRDTWQSLHRYHGRSVRLDCGSQVVQGTVVGISRTGELVLQIANKREHFAAGEVSLRESDTSPL